MLNSRLENSKANYSARFSFFSLQVCFHNEKAEFLAAHSVRVPRDGTVADVLDKVAAAAGPKAAGQPLRLLEIYNSKLWKVRGGAAVLAA